MDPIEIHIEPSQKRGASFGAPRCLWEVQIISESHGTESFFVPKAVAKAVETNLGKGTVLSRAEALEELARIQAEEAWKKAVGCLERRDYSAKELIDRLMATGFSRKAATEAASKAQDLRILDDLRFADLFISSKQLSGWGRLRIACELERRGISPDTIPGWPEGYFDEDQEFERAWQLIARKPIPEKNGYQKLVAFLVRKGYGLQVAKDCVAERLEGRR